MMQNRKGTTATRSQKVRYDFSVSKVTGKLPEYMLNRKFAPARVDESKEFNID